MHYKNDRCFNKNIRQLLSSKRCQHLKSLVLKSLESCYIVLKTDPCLRLDFVLKLESFLFTFG